MILKKLKLLIMRMGTLFTGIGSPEQAGMRVYGSEFTSVFACEWDNFARESFEANYNIATEHFHKDINDMDGKQYARKVDVIVGGSPCQSFSIAGLKKGLADKRGQLIWQYYRIIKEAEPEIFVYENVKGMKSDDNGKTLKNFIEVFRELGYHCHYDVLNTKDYGVPQNRERVYIVGFKDADLYHRFAFAPKVELTKRLKDVLEDDVDEKYYLSEKAMSFYKSNSEKNKLVGNGFRFSPTDGNSIAKTLTNPGKNRMEANYIADKNGIRKPTPRECFTLQDFPKTFKIVVSDSQAYKQAGNSMSVNILEMIFIQIEKVKSAEPMDTLFDFL